MAFSALSNFLPHFPLIIVVFQLRGESAKLIADRFFGEYD
jgi:hypothetical protein